MSDVLRKGVTIKLPSRIYVRDYSYNDEER
jgi:hypothetical protein